MSIFLWVLIGISLGHQIYPPLYKPISIYNDTTNVELVAFSPSG